MTAADVREVLVKEARSDAAPLSFSSLTSILVVDDDEFDILLSKPEAFLITDLIGITVTHPRNEEIGTGPYRVSGDSGSERTANEYAKLEAFPAYYRGKPRTHLIEVKAYATQRNAWAALMRGEINALHELSPGAFEFVEKESSVQTYTSLRGYYQFLGFNMSHPVLARREVRQALSQAVNREEIVQRALKGRGQPAEGPVWPLHWAYSTAQRGYTYNPEAAMLRLDAAGLTMRTKTAAGSAMPSRFRFKCLILDNARWEEMALLVQKQLFEVGVDMEVEAKPFAEFRARMSEGRFDSVLGEYTSGRSLAWVYYGWHSSHPIPYSPKTGYKAADGVLDRLRHATNDQEIRGYVGELQRVLFDDPPAIFIAWPYSSRAVSTEFTVPQEPNSDIIGNIWQWEPRAEPVVARR